MPATFMGSNIPLSGTGGFALASLPTPVDVSAAVWARVLTGNKNSLAIPATVVLDVPRRQSLADKIEPGQKKEQLCQPAVIVPRHERLKD